jgi:signal transduction histidine kinase
VIGDRVQIQQVILNLLLNACDAIKGIADGLPRIILVTTADDGAGAGRFTVRDSGPGIPLGTLGKLFDAFYTTKPDGMGIGLSVSRSIIDRHRGRLWAQDNLPGAIFAFSIPSAVSNAQAIAPQ